MHSEAGKLAYIEALFADPEARDSGLSFVFREFSETTPIWKVLFEVPGQESLFY